MAKFNTRFYKLFKKIFTGVCAAVFAAVLGVFILQNITFTREFVSAQNYSYPVVKLFSREHKFKVYKKAEISFKFKQNFWAGGHDNFFQTSDNNNGIRLEMGRAGNAWALLFKGTKEPLMAAMLDPLPKMGQWHEFRAFVEGDYVKIMLDSSVIFNRTLGGITYNFDEIILGAAMSGNRPFGGQIQNFTLKASYNIILSHWFNFIFYQMLFFILLWLYYKFVFKKRGIRLSFLRSPANLLFMAVCLVCAVYALRYQWKSSWIKDLSNNFLIYWQFGLLFICSVFLYGGRTKNSLVCPLAAFASLFMLLAVYVMNVAFSGIAVFFLLAFTAGLAAAYIYSAIPSKFWRRSFGVLSALSCAALMLPLSFIGFYLKKAGNRFLYLDEISAVFQSNLGESYEFAFSFFTAPELLLIVSAALGAVALFCAALVRAQGLKEKFSLKWLAAMALFVCVFVYAEGSVKDMYGKVQTAKSNYLQISADFKKYRDFRRSSNSALEAEKKEKGELYVLVIGESSNPRHWSAYGYFRDTTPWAKEQLDNPGAVFFTRAYSSYVHTVPALLKAFTSANQYNKEADYSAPSLIGLARAAGFKVYWLSNQDKISLVDNPLTALAEEADKTVFTNTSRIGTDLDILPLVDKALAEADPAENNLILVHIMGSHAKYDKRLPRGFKADFPSGEEYLGNHARDEHFVKKTLNGYDSTILFSDGILKSIYERTEKFPAPVKAFLAFSDHGEDVYGRSFHNSAMFTYEMTHIPMFALLSPEYQKRYPATVSALRTHAGRVFTLDLLFNMAAGLMNIKTPVNDRAYDITSPEYILDEGNAITMYTDESLQKKLYRETGAKRIADDPVSLRSANLKELKKLYPSKSFGAVHVDAAGAAWQAAQEGFGAFEINVDAQTKKIGHAPKLLYDVTLDEFLAKTPLGSGGKIWLDVKDLKEENLDGFLSYINELDKKYNLKGRTLVESWLASSEMARFTEDGWRTSFYIWYGARAEKNIIEKSSRTEEEEKAVVAYAREIADAVKRQKSSDISFFGYSYPFIKRYVEPLLPQGVKYNVFAVPGLPPVSSPGFIGGVKGSAIINDERTEFVLIPPETYFSITL